LKKVPKKKQERNGTRNNANEKKNQREKKKPREKKKTKKKKKQKKKKKTGRMLKKGGGVLVGTETSELTKPEQRKAKDWFVNEGKRRAGRYKDGTGVTPLTKKNQTGKGKGPKAFLIGTSEKLRQGQNQTLRQKRGRKKEKATKKRI